MTIPFFDLSRQYDAIATEIEAATTDVLRSQHYIGGPAVESLEQRLADRVGVDHAIGVSSGTDALLVSLMALDIGPGDEVITTPFTFFSPVEGVVRRGARPVFVDIEPETYNLDARRLDDAITDNTRAILPVHLYGQSCDMTAICRTADAHDLFVVEDMAQSIDATHCGDPTGSRGTVGCLSFYPTKNLGAAGDGGMVFCDDDGLAGRIRRLTRHGADPKYHHREIGGNFRLDALQAAILGVKLDHLDRWTERRREHAAFYDEAFDGVDPVTTPVIDDDNRSVYHQYTVCVPRRDELRRWLDDNGIGTNIYYPEPLHTQPAVDDIDAEDGDLPHAETVCRQVLSLPIFPELTDDERRQVADAIVRFFDN